MDHSSKYSEKGFWNTVKKYTQKIGIEGVRNALRLYYVLQKPNLPAKVKATILGALGYLISPIDAIPDFIPIAGFSDDLGVLAAAIAAIGFYIDDEVKNKADEKLAEWFG